MAGLRLMRLSLAGHVLDCFEHKLCQRPILFPIDSDEPEEREAMTARRAGHDGQRNQNSFLPLP
jgi:hypothetical protein